MPKYNIVATREIQVDGAPDGVVKGEQVIGTLTTDLHPKTLLGLLAYSAAAEFVETEPEEAESEETEAPAPKSSKAKKKSS